MKEIDINIEGYNVNGICVGCLNYNRKMLYSNYTKNCFKLLAEIEVPDGLNIQVCWECLALIKKVYDFKSQIEKSYNILQAYSKQHMFLNSPYDLSKHAVEKLKCVTYTHSTHYDDLKENFLEKNADVDTAVVKSENEDENLKEEPKDFTDDITIVKEELPIEVDTDFANETDFPDTTFEQGYSDDEPIANLKKKKKRHRKEKHTNSELLKESTNVKSKKLRKLKNLPEDIVTLYTMTEEELWQVRSQDLVNDEFLKLKYKCIECILKFNSEKLMTDHMASKHKPKSGNVASSQCDVCKSYFRIKDSLILHRNLHYIAYICRPCNFKTTLKRIMLKHVMQAHRDASNLEDVYRCSECSKEFISKSKLAYHRGICLQERPQCDCCGKVFANKLTLKHHLKSRGKQACEPSKSRWSPPSWTLVNPKEPSVSFLGKNRVFDGGKSGEMEGVDHLNSHSLDETQQLKPLLDIHILTTNQKDISNNKTDSKLNEKTIINCKDCNKVFHSRKSYTAHVVIHEGVVYPCPVCGKLFSWRRNLNRHLRNHREREAGAVHECRLCGKRFSSRDCYNNHMRFSKRHADERHYQHECSHCGKKFPTKWCMIDHIDWDHLKKIKYQCGVCLKAFKTAKIKVAHMNNIHGSKKKESEGEHLCEICGKSYKTVKRLKGHVWAMHTHRATGKSYKCKLCPATFTWQTSIYKHMKMMHDTARRPNTKPTYPINYMPYENAAILHDANRDPDAILPDLA